jgi:outer membrane protein assembly factor BamB
MAGNGRVFISHSHEDNARCTPLLAALDAWGVDYFFDTQGLGAGQQLHETIQKEIGARDIFLRVCTAATLRSFWMSLEVNAFRGLLADDQRHGRAGRRLLINLILDGDYSREPFDNATLFIDAATRPRRIWMGELARALGMAQPKAQRGVSRREVLAYGAAAAVTLSSTAAAGALFLDYRSRTQAPPPSTAKFTPGKPVWKLVKASPKKDIPPVPVVAGNTVYAMTVTGITAYDLAHMANGGPRKLWSKEISPKFGYVNPAVYGDTLYVGADWTLYALSARDGKSLWSLTLPKGDNGTLDAQPLLVNGTMYLFSQTGHLYAYDLKTRQPRWSNPVEMPGHLLDHASGAAIDGDSAYIGSLDHNFYALKVADGSMRWKVPTRGKIISTPAVVDGVVYVGSGDSYVYALNARDGSIKWKYLTGGDVESSPAVVDGVVYIASDDHYLYTLDAETGHPYWRAPIGDLDTETGIISNGGPVTCQPAVTGDAVCVIDNINNTVRAYNRHDGELRWKVKSPSFQNADPITADGLILFGSGDQTLYAFGA